MPQKTIYVPVSLWDKIQKIATETDQAPHAVMIAAMREGIEKTQKEPGE